MRLSTRIGRLWRGTRHTVLGFADRHRPLLVHIVPLRRCNLACTYCNEYDHSSLPVPLPEMEARVRKIRELGAVAVTISGGEPLMHPDLDQIVAAIRRRGMFATLITNGYYLSPERIHRLNRAGLDHLQISIDNVEPDGVSLKSLRLLETKLGWLAEHRDFSVNINSVIGSGVERPEDALAVARHARGLGFSTTLGVAHNGQGQLRPLSEREMKVYRELRSLEALRWTRINASFQENLVHGRPNQWSCRAGARYLYVDEGGLVHYCSQQRGTPGIPLALYTRDDIRREYDTPKGCSAFCTINCVQQVAWFDRFRGAQKLEARPLGGFTPGPRPEPLPSAHEGGLSPVPPSPEEAGA